MRVSAYAMVHGSREWLLWADGKTYASLGAAQSALERELPPGVAIRTAIGTAEDAERLRKLGPPRRRARSQLAQEQKGSGYPSEAAVPRNVSFIG